MQPSALIWNAVVKHAGPRRHSWARSPPPPPPGATGAVAATAAAATADRGVKWPRTAAARVCERSKFTPLDTIPSGAPTRPTVFESYTRPERFGQLATRAGAWSEGEESKEEREPKRGAIRQGSKGS